MASAIPTLYTITQNHLQLLLHATKKGVRACPYAALATLGLHRAGLLRGTPVGFRVAHAPTPTPPLTSTCATPSPSHPSRKQAGVPLKGHTCLKTHINPLNVIIKIILILAFYCPIAHAQPLRITIEARSETDQFGVAPLQEKGIIIFYENSPRSQAAKTQKWVFTKYDTLFIEEWEVEYPLQNNMTLIKHQVMGDYLYMLFAHQQNFQILKMDHETGEIGLTNGRLPKETIYINDFAVLNDNAFIGGSIMPPDAAVFFRSCLGFVCFPLLFIPNFLPEKSAFLQYSSMLTKANRIVKTETNGKAEVLSLEADTTKLKVEAIIKEGKNNRTKIKIQEYKMNGVRTQQYYINPLTNQFCLSDAKMVTAPNGQRYYIGTYGYTGNAGMQGIYVSGYNGTKQQFIQYLSFTTFKNFFEYLPKREQEKIKQKIEKRKKRGRDLPLNYQLLLHTPILIDSNQILVVAEAYYPQYHTEFRTTWYYGRPVETAVEIFDGWRYTHAIIACVDANGNLLWDNSIPIQDILTFNLSEKVKIVRANQQYIAAYANRGRIQYRVLQQDSAITHKEYESIAIDTDRENVKQEWKSQLEHWYGKYFIAYGAQRVKNLDTDYTKRKGTIFYFNKQFIKPEDTTE